MKSSRVGRGEFLNVALIVLYDDQRRVLLQHRTKDAERLPGYWAFFGGGIKKGETPEMAVRREALEEIAYAPPNPALVMEQDFVLPNAEGHMFVFIDHYPGDKSLLKLHEGQGWGWFARNDMAGLKMIDHDRRVVSEIFERIG